MNHENSGRVAVIAGTGADMGSPNGVIGSGRTGRAQARRIKVIVCHRVTSVSVSTSNAHTQQGRVAGLHPDSRAPLEPARC